MKIVLHSNIAWTISNFRLELIKFLINSKFEVICIANIDTFSNTSVKEIEETGAKFIKLSLDRKGINPINDLLYFSKLLFILKREKPDLIINYTIKPVIYGSLSARFLRIKSISVITGLGYVFTSKNYISQIVINLYKISLKKVNRVLFLNQSDLNDFISYNIIPSNKAIVLPGEGINTEYFSPIFEEKKINQCFTFIQICRLLKDKGLIEYFKAAENIKSKYKHVEFKLLGFIDENNPNGITLEEIKVLENKGIITYCGFSNDVRKFISNSDCVVLASFYREGLPRTLLEAASMGKPIITTKSIGCADTVNDGETGFLCEPRNSVSLELMMEKMLKKTPNERIIMGLKGREKIIKEFDQKIINSIYYNLINSIQNESFNYR
jgi:glycosyltransferase involved in cell wall biosynthesis